MRNVCVLVLAAFLAGCASNEVVRTTYETVRVPMGDVTCKYQLSPQDYDTLYCTDHKTREQFPIIVPKGKKEI